MRLSVFVPLIATVVYVGCARAQADASPRHRELAREAGLAEAVVEPLLRHGSDLKRLEGIGQDGQVVPVAGLTVALPEAQARRAVSALREALGPGYVVFQSAQNFGSAPDRVAVLRSTDPFDPLRTMATNGTNYDIHTDSIITRLADWDRRYGLTIVGAGLDWVEAELVRPPPDWVAFAREVYEFCPDIVDQGTETVEALAEEMKESRTVYLWWD